MKHHIPDGEPEHLVTSGPFASRNPIYLGMLGVLISVGFFSSSSFLIPVLFIFIIENTWIKHEDKLKTLLEKEWKVYVSKPGNGFRSCFSKIDFQASYS